MIEQACVEIAEKASAKGYILEILAGGFSISFIFGLFNFPELFSKRNKMFRETSTLTKYNKGIVTVLDLVVAAEVSPEKASKFLTEFARKLEVEPEIDENTGTIFYRFINSDRIEEYEIKKEIKGSYK